LWKIYDSFLNEVDGNCDAGSARCDTGGDGGLSKNLTIHTKRDFHDMVTEFDEESEEKSAKLS